ncbi:MAG: SCP2 sterol-binding domain-containing protein [Candidatus Lokiarchaeota archaeon]|nr:SCP2 sterol-binding domain-containing protein [Candidatus Lokiarchaeota archaeon]
MDETEKNNITETFKASLDSIFKEKLEQEKWRKKLENFTARVNLAVVCPPDEANAGGAKDDKIYLHIVADKGAISVEPGKLDDAEFELAASFALFFTVATGEASAVKALFSGALKATNMLKKIKKLLFMQKLLVLDKQ